MTDPRGANRWAPTTEQWAGGMIDGAVEMMDDAGDILLRDAPKTARFILKRIPGVPGLVYSGVQVATAKDKGRAMAEFAGGTAGATVGGLLLGPAGAVAGSALGSRAGEVLYDDRDEIAAWMAARRAQLARDLERHILPPALRRPY